jgi:hypothetical protein
MGILRRLRMTGTMQNDGRGDVDIAPYEGERCTQFNS